MIENSRMSLCHRVVDRVVTVLGYLWPIPVMYFFYTYGRFAVNAPFGDDIPLIIGRTVDYLHAEDFWSGLSHIFGQSEEYRVPFIVLSGIISTKVFGYINFNFIGLLGNASLIAAFFIIVLALTKTAREFRTFATISFLLLASPVYAGCMFWTNCTIGHFGSIFCGALACFFLSRPGVINFLLFELTLVIAILAHGNGIGLLPIGFLGIWYANKEKHKIIFCSLHAVISILVITAAYVTFDENIGSFIYERSLLSIMNSPWEAFFVTIKWFFAWIGSWSSFTGSVALALIVGMIEVLILALLLYIKREALFCHYGQISLLIIFLLLTIGGASLFRAHFGLGIEHIFTDRFRIYSLALLICIVCLVLTLARNEWCNSPAKMNYWNMMALVAILASGFYFVKVNYDQQPHLVAHKNQQLKCAGEWEQEGIAKPCTWHMGHKVIMDRAVEIGILHINKNGVEPLRCQEPYLKYCWK